MRMKKIPAILCLLLWGATVTQNDEAHVKNLTDTFTEKLQERGIANYFTATMYCMGNIQIFTLNDGTRCTSKGTYVETYVFWNETNGTSWIKKIDNCGMYLSVELTDSEILSFAQQNADALESKAVKRFETENMKNGRPASRTTIYNCMRNYAFGLNGKNFTHEFNTMVFLKASGDKEEDRNLNYEYNMVLPVASLNAQCEKLVETLVSQAQFKRM